MKNKRKLTNMGLFLMIFNLLSGCAQLSRSFVDEMDRDSDGIFVPGKDFQVMAGDTGDVGRSKEEVRLRTPGTEREKRRQKEMVSLRAELNKKEEDLSPAEFEQYKKDSQYLPSESDKLYYLSLSGADRSNYMETKKSEYREDHGHGKDILEKRSIHSQELYVGMSKDEVMKTWGKPSKVQYAGNPKNQNELWMFNEDGSIKQIFFESGKVNGWSLDI